MIFDQIMKAKFIVIAACAAVALVGCTKKKFEPSSVVSSTDSPILFEAPILSPATKAVVDFPDDAKFLVSAYKYKGTYAAWNNSSLWMNRVEIRKEPTAVKAGFASWGPATKYYWPKDGSKLAFSAFAPETATSLVIGPTGITASDYTTLANQVDILYSDRVIDLDENTEYAADAIEASHQKLYGVQIKFNHALSRLDFTLKTAEDYSASKTVTLTSIAVNHLIKAGNFDQTLGAAEAGKGTPKWTVANEPSTGTYTYSAGDFGNYSVSGIAAAGLTITDTEKGSGAASADFDPLYLIPQNLALLTGEDYANSKIVVKYDITTGSGAAAVTEHITYEKPLKDLMFNDTGNEQKLMIGKKYCINITIGLNEIYFAPVVGVWDDVTINDVNETTGDADPDINIDPAS